MSLSLSTYDHDNNFPKLHASFSNWRTWIEHAKDHIQGGNPWRAGQMVKDTWWDNNGADPALVYLNLPTTNADEKAFKVAHQQAFRFLRSKLEDAVYNKTMQLEYKTVPHLLRFLRLQWNDGSAVDRARLRDEMKNIRIDKFNNYSEYEAAFVNLCASMEANNITDYVDDESKLWRLIEGLDATWKIQIEMVNASELPYARAKAYFQKVAKQDHSITGSLAVASTKPKRLSERVHFTDTTKQVCIQHAKTGQCRFGDACKFAHGKTHTQAINDDAGAGSDRALRRPGDNAHCAK